MMLDWLHPVFLATLSLTSLLVHQLHFLGLPREKYLVLSLPSPPAPLPLLSAWSQPWTLSLPLCLWKSALPSGPNLSAFPSVKPSRALQAVTQSMLFVLHSSWTPLSQHIIKLSLPISTCLSLILEVKICVSLISGLLAMSISLRNQQVCVN